MEKTQLEMDLDEWEYLPDHGFLDLNNEGSEDKKIFSSGKGKRGGSTNYSSTVFNMNYFMCPSPTCEKIVEESSPSKRFNKRVGGYHQQVVPVPIQLEPRIVNNNNDNNDNDNDNHNHNPDDGMTTKNIVLMSENQKMMTMVNKDPGFGSAESNQDAVSQVFFKKMGENEFVDMKMDSPRSPTTASRNIIIPPPSQLDAPAFHSEAMDSINPCSPRNKTMDSDKEENIVDWEENNDGGFDLWKWSLTGIGAICSFGVAAATVCIIIFGSQQRNSKQQQHHNQKLRFQIYADDKRIKQVVRQATKFNEAISAVRGVPISRAHITYGGYYDSL